MALRRDSVMVTQEGRSLDEPLTEKVEMRSARSKAWEMPDGKVHVATRLRPVHYDDAGEWKDIDLTIVNGRMDKASYIADVLAGKIGYRHTSRSGGWMQVELVSIDGALVGTPKDPRYDGNEAWWDEVVPGLSFRFECRELMAEMWKHTDAPHVLVWRVTDSGDFPGVFKEDAKGKDADGNALEILTSRNRQLFTEEWTGRASVITDRATRQREWREAKGPVVWDVSITENISAGADDGVEIDDTTWVGIGQILSLGVVFGYSYDAGFRFPDVSVPAGVSSIDAATLTVDITTDYGATADIYADDVDDAAAWGSSSRPTQITKTTAKTSWNPSGTGLTAINVATIVAEVVARGGWAENNAIRFAMLQTSGGFAYLYIEGYEFAGTDEAQLDVTYTAGGGGTAVKDIIGGLGIIPFAR